MQLDWVQSLPTHSVLLQVGMHKSWFSQFFSGQAEVLHPLLVQLVTVQTWLELQEG